MPKEPQAPKQILMIDDEVALTKFVKRNLERSGEYQVTLAHSGAEGLAKAKATRFDLIITDYKMPELNGEQVLNALKAHDDSPPVVLFSIYHDDDGTLSPNILVKADGIISKPIDHAQLYQVIKDALAKRRSRG
ncbi:MAG: response regulator [Candidatus Omnitrophica bacterium]|nr:response regulator [Candidatus Omnitrophota bacterium]